MSSNLKSPNPPLIPVANPPPDPAVRVIPKVWITQYALTQGVLTALDAEFDPQYKTMIVFPQTGVINRAYIHKPHWHETEDEARAQVAKMIAAQKKSLSKKLAKLDSYCFTTSPWNQ